MVANPRLSARALTRAGNRRPGDHGDTSRAKTDDFAHKMYFQASDFAVVERVAAVPAIRHRELDRLGVERDLRARRSVRYVVAVERGAPHGSKLSARSAPVAPTIAVVFPAAKVRLKWSKRLALAG